MQKHTLGQRNPGDHVTLLPRYKVFTLSWLASKEPLKFKSFLKKQLDFVLYATMLWPKLTQKGWFIILLLAQCHGISLTTKLYQAFWTYDGCMLLRFMLWRSHRWLPQSDHCTGSKVRFWLGGLLRCRLKILLQNEKKDKQKKETSKAGRRANKKGPIEGKR